MTDGEIAALLEERKRLPANWSRKIRTRNAYKGYYRANIPVVGVSEQRFEIRTRRSVRNPFDFMVGLWYVTMENHRYNLVRYNGRSHPHKNPLEDTRFRFEFHVHHATERYQRAGYGKDKYAEVTDHYNDFDGALTAFLEEAQLVQPEEGGLFSDN